MKFLKNSLAEVIIILMFLVSIFFCFDVRASCGSDGCGHADHLRKLYHD